MRLLEDGNPLFRSCFGCVLGFEEIEVNKAKSFFKLQLNSVFLLIYYPDLRKWMVYNLKGLSRQFMFSILTQQPNRQLNSITTQFLTFWSQNCVFELLLLGLNVGLFVEIIRLIDEIEETPLIWIWRLKGSKNSFKMACRGCLECLLKLLNFVLTLVGLAIVGYGIYLLVEYLKVADSANMYSPAGEIDDLIQLGRPMLTTVSLSASFWDNLPKAWYAPCSINCNFLLYFQVKYLY